eukprot:3962136-Heterocapsa_arctica.AAC.1
MAGQSLSSRGRMESTPGALTVAMRKTEARISAAVRGATLQGEGGGIKAPHFALKSSKVGGVLEA